MGYSRPMFQRGTTRRSDCGRARQEQLRQPLPAFARTRRCWAMPLPDTVARPRPSGWRRPSIARQAPGRRRRGRSTRPPRRAAADLREPGAGGEPLVFEGLVLTSGLPARFPAPSSTSGTATDAAATTTGASAIAATSSRMRPGRIPVPDDQAGPLYGPHAAYPCESAGRGDAPAHHAGLFPGLRGRQCPRFHLPGRPAAAPRPDCRRRVARAVRLRAPVGLIPAVIDRNR